MKSVILNAVTNHNKILRSLRSLRMTHGRSSVRHTTALGATLFGLCQSYSFGPAATRALPASLLVYLSKFLMNLPARSLAFSSHSDASA